MLRVLDLNDYEVDFLRVDNLDFTENALVAITEGK